jgi:hypothetical protein
MLAAVLILLWLEVAGVTELIRLLNRKGFLCVNPKKSTTGIILIIFNISCGFI